jgi:S-adenosylmethionine hydrolase
MSDFGTIDDSVAICKGVMLGIDSDLRIIDITHEVQPFSIMDAARFLAGTAPHFPSGAVFVVVVDPGVGSVRKPIVVKSRKNQFFVLPDNGLVTLVAEADGIESVREITNTKWMIGNKLSSTFHGRDIFAPVAAHLANGKNWTEVGPELSNPVRLDVHRASINDNGLTGEILGTDGPYGNLTTNIPAETFHKMNIALGENIRSRIGERDFEIPYVKTFSDVPVGQPLFYIDSRGRLGIAINQGNFADAYKIRPPTPILIYRNQK